ncbi:EBS1 [[Candida] subhashii]|uniref:Nonsense-mediated mRNA decay factor n=1 Tax=[Candida] subhashii TaxID=561895 RepID=A0A8J5QG26_9ASCO|nr:EBS1 [[Candida] subhashii]KAG7660892.1 EBS1 [[Candida] subhashii]
MSIQSNEIQRYKVQLQEFLTKKFTDQHLLIGFNTLLQSKFQGWIVNDLNDYYKQFDPSSAITAAAAVAAAPEFNTMKYLEILWNEFHYPIIKYFQHQHHSIFQSINEEFKQCQLKNLANQFKVKPIEIRKVNDNFMKFSKQIFQFYSNLLKYFTIRFKNSFIPNEFLNYFQFSISSLSTKSIIECNDNNFQANVLYLIHKCCLSLGDICRHQSYIETSYVNPCISNKAFFKFRSMTDKERNQEFFPKYSKSIQYYKFAILLLPALNEPYNHIGMIYNLVEDKFNCIYWFLRSNFTRIPEYKLGLNNLNTILNKHWFLTALVDCVNSNPERKFNIQDNLNIYLICLIGYFYLPKQYKNGPNLVKKLTFSKIETDFFKLLKSKFLDLIKNDQNEINFILKQLVILFSFCKLQQQQQQQKHGDNEADNDELLNKMIKFTFRFIEQILDCFKAAKFHELKITNICICLRFILNWLRENKNMYLTFESRKKTMQLTISIMNKLVEYQQISLHQDNIIIQNRPERQYYFWEDAHFRDFSLIKFQFKDFKDDELFSLNNINYLVGDYSELINIETSIPKFLNEQTQSTLVDKIKQFPKRKANLIKTAIENYENQLRIQAILVLGKRLLEASTSFECIFDVTKSRFLMKEIPKKQITLNKENNIKENQKNNDLSDKTLGSGKKQIEKNQSEVSNRIEKSEKVKGRKEKSKEKSREKPNENSKEKSKEDNSKGDKSEDESQVAKPQDDIAREDIILVPESPESGHEGFTSQSPRVVVPNSLEEIESFIAKHSNQLVYATAGSSTSPGIDQVDNIEIDSCSSQAIPVDSQKDFQDMVDSLVEDVDMNNEKHGIRFPSETSITSGIPMGGSTNIWKQHDAVTQPAVQSQQPIALGFMPQPLFNQATPVVFHSQPVGTPSSFQQPFANFYSQQVGSQPQMDAQNLQPQFVNPQFQPYPSMPYHQYQQQPQQQPQPQQSAIAPVGMQNVNRFGASLSPFMYPPPPNPQNGNSNNTNNSENQTG